MEVFWEYARAFLCGGVLCLIGQLLIDKTKLTPARILVLYVVSGVVLGGLGWWSPPTSAPPSGSTARPWNMAASAPPPPSGRPPPPGR